MQIYDAFMQSLPFAFTRYDFMNHALLAVLLLCPVYGLMGSMVVNNRLSFFSDALGHSALTGIAIGVLLGMKDTTVSTVLFAVLFALLISYVRRRGKASSDTVISVFSSIAIALGLVLLSHGGGFAKYSSFLVGDILSVSVPEIGMLFFVMIAIVIGWALLFNSLLVVSVNPSLASSKKMNVALVEDLFLVMIAVLVTVSISKIGLLIINSMLILPAASARNLAKNNRRYHVYSLLISLGCGIVGLIASFYFDTTAGASMVLVMGLVFFISLLATRRSVPSANNN